MFLIFCCWPFSSSLGVCHRGEGLSKTAIGDYLGEKSPFHEQVLKAFVDLHDFTDLIIVQALR
jgi:cytohesin